MKVSELRAELADLDPELEVFLRHDPVDGTDIPVGEWTWVYDDHGFANEPIGIMLWEDD
jgi:hypothetical protein